MAVRKPLEKVDVDALIDAGSKVKEDFKKQSAEWIIINLRLSTQMLEEVDRAVGERIGIKRTGWILEAIHEKLKDL